MAVETTEKPGSREGAGAAPAKRRSPRRTARTAARLSGRIAKILAPGKWLTAPATRRAAAVAMVAALLAAAGWRVRTFAGSRPDFRLDVAGATLAVGEVPWAKDEARRAIGESVNLHFRAVLQEIAPHGITLLDGDTAARLGEAFTSRCAWVARVRRVDLAYPDRVAMFVDLRRPSIAVKTAGAGFVILDDEGCRVPLEAPDAARLAALTASLNREVFQVSGLAGDAPASGLAWPDPAVHAALALAEALRAERLMPAVALDSLRVEGAGAGSRRPDLWLVLKSNARVRWGKSPLEPLFQEPTVAAKAAELRRLLAGDPSGARFATIDLTTPRAVAAPAGLPPLGIQ
ncbi:MAG: hypothetical protein HY719_14645 [Planctomycetes bacterium]|nr:hypothetical protein [Planctomycetota bacterium]